MQKTFEVQTWDGAMFVAREQYNTSAEAFVALSGHERSMPNCPGRVVVLEVIAETKAKVK